MIFVATLIFTFLFYILPLRFLIVERFILFPFLGAERSYVLTGILIYFSIVAILYAIKQFHELFWPNLPFIIRNDIVRRTGVFKIERYGFWIALISILIFSLTDIKSIPLGFAALVGFGWLRTQPIVLRPVGQIRKERKTSASVAGKAREAAESEENDQVVREYIWQLDKPVGDPIPGQLEIAINAHKYQSFVERNPFKDGAVNVHNYKQFVSLGSTDEVSKIADYLISIFSEYKLTPYEEIAYSLSFVKSIPYLNDIDSKGNFYLRYPIETLYENVGDDNCKAILFASILKALNYRPLIAESPNEIGVAVAGAEGFPGHFFEYEGERHFYCPTGNGKTVVGQLPFDLSVDSFKVFRV